MPAVPDVTAAQVLAFRVAGHHLHERTDPLTAVAACGLQEYPPGHAPVALSDVEDELTAVRLDGSRRWILAADLDRLRDPPQATGVRLLHGYDPYVAGPDRATLVPDTALRKALFPAVGRPGVVLADGRLAGVWRGRKKGRTLELAVEWTGRPVGLGDAPGTLARLRGCDHVRVA